MKILVICASFFFALVFTSCKNNRDSTLITETAEYKRLLNENDSLKKLLESDYKQITEINSNFPLLYHERISILEIQTGFDPYHNTMGLWVPSVAIKFINISKRDIKETIDITVIFIDNTKGEQISSDSDYLVLGKDYFLSGTSKQCTLSSSIGWNSINNQDITARIYFKDELINTIKVDNQEFDGMIR